MPTTTLSFTVSIARTHDELQQACHVRSESYGRHLPALKAALAQPDALDTQAGVGVLLCRDKLTGAPIGTARVQTDSFVPLLIEGSITVPQHMNEDSRAEITRLAVMTGRTDPLIKLALMKASYLYCLANQVHWMVIGARSEALVRQYRRLGFDDLYDDGRPVPLAHAGNIDHWILAFDVTAAERYWYQRNHPLYKFMVQTVHPDIQLFPTPVLNRLETLVAA